MKVSEFLEKTKELSGNTLVYISCHSIDILQQYDGDFYSYKETYLHKVIVGVDQYQLFCDIIWEFNMTPERYKSIETATLREIRGDSFDADKDADLVSSTDDNASEFYKIDSIVISKKVYYGKDVIILFL